MVYVDIEMNSLEDAYVNIAKAEEKLHHDIYNDYAIDKAGDDKEDFQRYLESEAHPNFC
jgi:hypothetical protein